jgi:hypothetical protein
MREIGYFWRSPPDPAAWSATSITGCHQEGRTELVTERHKSGQNPTSLRKIAYTCAIVITKSQEQNKNNYSFAAASDR